MSKFTEHFIQQYHPDIERMAFDGSPLLSISGGVIKEVNVANASKIFIVTASGERCLVAEELLDTHFFELLCLVDNYGRGTYKLPRIQPRKFDPRTPEELEIAINLLFPLVSTQNEFELRLSQANTAKPRAFDYLELESFDGTESLTESINGKNIDIESEFRFFVRKLTCEGGWLVFRKERGSEKQIIKIYNQEYIYLFLLNFHFDAL